MRAYYDLHIHSCLSPCADDDMTPNNIVNMAFIKGLDVIAVTDHNCAMNISSVVEIGNEIGLLVVPGMEIQTREEIHALCYFRDVESITAFSEALEPYRMPIPNRVDKFGHQWVMNANDEVISEYPYALILSLSIGLEDLDALVDSHQGVMIPAHINKGANSLLKYLGFIPESLKGRTMELFQKNSVDPMMIEGSRIIYNSDAHFITDIHERVHFMNIEALTVDDVLNYLKGRKSL